MAVQKKILPSGAELILYVVISAVIILVSNIQVLVGIFGTSLEQDFVNSYLSETFDGAFTTYTSRYISPDTADFVFWLIVSLLILSFLKAAHKAYSEVVYDMKFSSDRYVHPSAFTERSFWTSTILNFFLQFISLSLTVFLWYSLVFFLMPLGILMARIYISEPQLSSKILYALGGLFVISAGITVSMVSLRVALLHPRLIPQNE